MRLAQLSAIERARRYVAKCPPAVSGQGGHNTAFRVAAALRTKFELSEAETLSLMVEYNRTCSPPWTERELIHKVKTATQAGHHEPHSLAARAPVFESPTDEASTYLKGFRCDEADLWHASPVELGDDPRRDGATLVEALYEPGEQINYVTGFAIEHDKFGVDKARPRGSGATMERNVLAAHWYKRGSDTDYPGGWMRMNPVDGKGIADANVTAFRFALLESDELPLDLQMALFARLSLPIAAILRSGARSIHAWVKVDAPNAEEYGRKVSRLFDLLARFGIDRKNSNPSRLSRLPGARRIMGAQGDGIQKLLYLNPKPDQRGIL